MIELDASAFVYRHEMVVLAASICTRGGKALLSRQFRDVSKDRITALLSNFPSLISQADSQHTTVEDEHVRYVYQPLEEFYIVLITNKSSNILQDIDTLRLFSGTVNNLLRLVDEREIFDNAFEIISAFDEVINLGYKENLSLTQIETFLEMESHEEKIQEIIERNKEMEATEERRRRAKEIQRKELARRNLEYAMPAMGVAASYENYQSQFNALEPSYPSSEILQNKPSSLSAKPVSMRGGLQLGKKGTKVPEQSQPLLSHNQPQFSHTPSVNAIESFSSKASTPVPQQAKVPNNGILVTINEKISAELTRDGSVAQSEVKGDLQLRINNPDLANARILLKTGEKNSGVQYKTHPNVDRSLFNQQSIIGLKDSTKLFPSNDQSLGVLRWRLISKADSLNTVPLLVTAWVNVDDNVATVTLECEITQEFIDSHSNITSIDDIKIILPVTSHDVNLKEESENISYDISEYGVVFDIASIPTDDPQFSFEFTVPVQDEDSLFPMEIQFEITKTDANESDTCFGNVQVLDVVSNTEDEASLPFDLHTNLITEEYQVT